MEPFQRTLPGSTQAQPTGSLFQHPADARHYHCRWSSSARNASKGMPASQLQQTSTSSMRSATCSARRHHIFPLPSKGEGHDHIPWGAWLATRPHPQLPQHNLPLGSIRPSPLNAQLDVHRVTHGVRACSVAMRARRT